MTRAFATRDLKWTPANGEICTAPRWTDVDLPPVIAMRTLKIWRGREMDDEIRHKASAARPAKQFKPKVADCTDLDHDAPVVSDPRVTPPILFEVVDRGPPRLSARPVLRSVLGPFPSILACPAACPVAGVPRKCRLRHLARQQFCIAIFVELIADHGDCVDTCIESCAPQQAGIGNKVPFFLEYEIGKLP